MRKNPTEHGESALQALTVKIRPPADHQDIDSLNILSARQLVDALPAAIYLTDSEGRITYFNDAAAALWGYRPKLHSDQWCGSWRLYSLDGTRCRMINARWLLP